jgi:hypothetical protein
VSERCERCGRELCGSPSGCRDEEYLCHRPGGAGCEQVQEAARVRAEVLRAVRATGLAVPDDVEMIFSGDDDVVVVIRAAPWGDLPAPGQHDQRVVVTGLRRRLEEVVTPTATQSGNTVFPLRLTKAENEAQLREELRRRQGRRSRW